MTGILNRRTFFWGLGLLLLLLLGAGEAMAQMPNMPTIAMTNDCSMPPSGCATISLVRAPTRRQPYQCPTLALFPSLCAIHAPAKFISALTSTERSASFSRPPSSGRSITNAARVTNPPAFRNNSVAAAAVPPVARRSSTII